MKTLALSLAIAAGPVWAESPTPPEPTPAKAYQSAFADYRPMQDEAVLDWRATNDEMGRLRSLSEILCVRHNMSARRSMYAKQDEQEETGSGAAQYSQRVH